MSSKSGTHRARRPHAKEMCDPSQARWTRRGRIWKGAGSDRCLSNRCRTGTSRIRRPPPAGGTTRRLRTRRRARRLRAPCASGTSGRKDPIPGCDREQRAHAASPCRPPRTTGCTPRYDTMRTATRRGADQMRGRRNPQVTMLAFSTWRSASRRITAAGCRAAGRRGLADLSLRPRRKWLLAPRTARPITIRRAPTCLGLIKNFHRLVLLTCI